MDEVEEIKRRIDIVDLISSYLTLKKAGSNYKAICPFHQEKTPSFMVSAEKQIFKCFGCGEGGDIFSFVEKMENLEFPEALRMLADRAGVQLKRRSFRPEEGKDRKTKLYQINDLSAKVFHKILIAHPAGKGALEYLKKRGITLEIIKDFMIGYAPSAKFLEGFLLKKGFSASEIQEAGAPNRFFRRIMFPIKDAMGNTIAFTGRVLDPKQEPKYLNTADTIIFHKGIVLYNLDQARGAVKQQNAVIVVEGQMDVIASYQAGVKNVVASSGTALTADHLQILYRYTPNITFSFDSDTAGLLTAKKAYQMAISEGFNVKMVLLGTRADGFKDPGEMIAKDAKLWQEAVEGATPVIDWYFDLAFTTKENREEKIELTSQKKKEIAKEILPIIKIIPDSIEQAHYINLLAKRLDVNEDIVFDALSKVQEKKNKALTGVPPQRKTLTSEQLLVAILLYKPAKINQIKDKINTSDIKDPILKKIYTELVREYNNGSITKNGKIEKSLFEANRELKNTASALILAAENLYFDEQDKIDEDLIELIKHISSAKKEALKAYYADEIKKAEKSRDIAKLKKLIEEFQNAIS